MRGRPKSTGRGTGVMVRCHEEQLKPLDVWIALQPEPQPSRPEAIRKLLDYALDELDPLDLKIVFRKLAKELTIDDVIYNFEKFVTELSDNDKLRGDRIKMIIRLTIEHQEKLKELIKN